MVGDWPHDALRPIYGEPWIQTGWHPSLGRMAGDQIDGYDIIILDKSVLNYSSEENYWKLFAEYLNNGGTLIRIVSKSVTNGGEIVDTIKMGKGTIIDVRVQSNPSYGSVSWTVSKEFWTNIFEEKVGSLRLIALTVTEFLMLGTTAVLIVCILSQLRNKGRDKQIVKSNA